MTIDIKTLRKIVDAERERRAKADVSGARHMFEQRNERVSVMAKSFIDDLPEKLTQAAHNGNRFVLIDVGIVPHEADAAISDYWRVAEKIATYCGQNKLKAQIKTRFGVYPEATIYVLVYY